MFLSHMAVQAQVVCGVGRTTRLPLEPFVSLELAYRINNVRGGFVSLAQLNGHACIKQLRFCCFRDTVLRQREHLHATCRVQFEIPTASICFVFSSRRQDVALILQ